MVFFLCDDVMERGAGASLSLSLSMSPFLSVSLRLHRSGDWLDGEVLSVDSKGVWVRLEDGNEECIDLGLVQLLSYKTEGSQVKPKRDRDRDRERDSRRRRWAAIYTIVGVERQKRKEGQGQMGKDKN